MARAAAGELTEVPFRRMDGGEQTLGDYAGKVVLVVNVASRCGLTSQYEGLEALYRQYEDRGLVVLGFPANDFAGQEPGTDEEIATFCSTRYDVTFPVMSKLVATGAHRHPIYSALTQAEPKAQGNGDAFRERLRGHGMTPTLEPELLWNFEKFVVGRDGKVVARFAPDTAPDDPALVAAIESALG